MDANITTTTVRPDARPLSGYYTLEVRCRFSYHMQGVLQTFQGIDRDTCLAKAREAGWSRWSNDTMACPSCTRRLERAALTVAQEEPYYRIT